MRRQTHTNAPVPPTQVQGDVAACRRLESRGNGCFAGVVADTWHASVHPSCSATRQLRRRRAWPASLQPRRGLATRSAEVRSRLQRPREVLSQKERRPSEARSQEAAQSGVDTSAVALIQATHGSQGESFVGRVLPRPPARAFGGGGRRAGHGSRTPLQQSPRPPQQQHRQQQSRRHQRHHQSRRHQRHRPRPRPAQQTGDISDTGRAPVQHKNKVQFAHVKLTYSVWKGTADVKTETPTSVRDFHDHDDFQKSADEHITWLRTQTKGEAVSKGRDEKSRKSGWAPSAEDIEVPAPPEDDPGVCEVCLRRFPGERFPFAMCRRCGDRPSWHHGRCCLWERRRTQTSANSSSTTIRCGPELGLKKRVTLGLLGNHDFWGVSSFRTLYSHF